MFDKIEISRELAERMLRNGLWPTEADELRALLAAPVVERQPAAYQRKWAFDGEKPYKEKNANGRMAWAKKFIFMPITPNKIFTDDVPLYTSPPAPVAVVLPDVDALAQIIRMVDGNHSLGAGALAERILDKVVKELNQ